MTPDFANPAAHEAELAIERQLPGRMTISATYLLTRGVRLPVSYDANVRPTTATKSYDVVTSAGATVLTATVPSYTAPRLDTGSGLILNQASVLNSWYNGLVLTLKKPMSHDVELLFNYTYSKALDDGETAGTNGTFFGTDGVLDPYNFKGDYSYSEPRPAASLCRERNLGTHLCQRSLQRLCAATPRRVVHVRHRCGGDRSTLQREHH